MLNMGHVAQQFTCRDISKRTDNICAYKNLHTNVHSSIVHNSPKVETTKCSSTDEWILVYPYNGVLLAIKIYATAWMNLENIMLSESSLKQKVTDCMISFM